MMRIVFRFSRVSQPLHYRPFWIGVVGGVLCIAGGVAAFLASTRRGQQTPASSSPPLQHPPPSSGDKTIKNVP